MQQQCFGDSSIQHCLLLFCFVDVHPCQAALHACCRVVQLAMTIKPDLPVCCATLNPWDDTLLALAGPRLARSYRLDVVAATGKPNNLLTLVRQCPATV